MSASVQITLDTRPPVLTVEAPDRVTPPEDWTVSVVASEDIGYASAFLVDSLGTSTSLGLERSGDRRFFLTVPTVGIAAGPGSLVLRVSDDVLNLAQAKVPIFVVRPEAYEVELSVSQGHETDLFLVGGYDITLGTEGSHFVTLEVTD